MRSVGMHGNKLILVIFSSNILQNPQEMGTFFISDFLQIMGHPSARRCWNAEINLTLCMSMEILSLSHSICAKTLKIIFNRTHNW